MGIVRLLPMLLLLLGILPMAATLGYGFTRAPQASDIELELEFVPIPLAWDKEDERRTLEFGISFRYNQPPDAPYNVFSFVTSSNSFSATATVKDEKLHFVLKIGDSVVYENAETPVAQNELSSVTIDIDFDKHLIAFNAAEDASTFASDDELPRSGDSFVLHLGSDRVDKLCVEVKSLVISSIDITRRVESVTKPGQRCNVEDDGSGLSPVIGSGAAVADGDPEPGPGPLIDEAANLALAVAAAAGDCSSSQKSECGDNYKNCSIVPFSENPLGFHCHCRDGYIGHFCQFSNLPRSCYHAFRVHPFGFNQPGIYQLDVDGSGPLTSSWAVCDGSGHTIVTHNMPNNTRVRSDMDTSNKKYNVSYKLFEPSQLSALIAASGFCSQQFSYDCTNAPLGFERPLTWFTRVGSGDKITHIGDCRGRDTCACDTEEKAVITGHLDKNEAGVETIAVVKDTPPMNTLVFAYMTLSPLVCGGSALFDKSVTLKSREASLEVSAGGKDGLHHLSFYFRTGDADISSLVTLVGEHNVLELSVRGGNVVVVEVKRANGIRIQLVAEPESRLDDFRWHYVLIELISTELRLTVDSATVFKATGEAALSPNIVFGKSGSKSGWLGCIYEVITEFVQPVDFSEKFVEGVIESGCRNLCEAHNCEHESICVEHFDINAFSCKCRIPLIQKGDRCEIDHNSESPVTFTTEKSYAELWEGNELQANPLTTDLALSFATTQERGLLLYAHDQSDNFIQLEIVDDLRVLLALTNYTGDRVAQVVACVVVVPAGVSTGSWVQVLVHHSPDRTTLTVNDEICDIIGPVVLAPSDVKIARFSVINAYDIVFPPRAQGEVKPVRSFAVAFVANVPRVNAPVVYHSTTPGFVGCLRGFVVGVNPVVLDAPDVITGCSAPACVSPCQNNGVCTGDSCQCFRTSFAGADCSVDHGLTLGGSNVLLFNIDGALASQLASNAQKVTLAFSATYQDAQVLETLTFDKETYLNVVVSSESLVVTTVGSQNPEVVLTAPGNFADGYRHSVDLRLSRQYGLLVVIDSIVELVNPQFKALLRADSQISIGGGKSTASALPYFTGCISNVIVDANHQSLPLVEAYYGGTNQTRSAFAVEPNEDFVFSSNTCSAAFAPLPTPPLRTVEFPVWDAEFQPVAFEYNLTALPDEPTDAFPIVLWIILLLIILALIVLCCFFVCYRRRRTLPYRPHDEEDPQASIPLKAMPAHSIDNVADNCSLPTPTKALFPNEAAAPLSSSPPPPYQEKPKPPPDESPADSDSMDAYSHETDDLDSTLANGFSEERPNVLDKHMAYLGQPEKPARRAKQSAM